MKVGMKSWFNTIELYMKDLPTDMRALELRFFEDKDFKEIAFILDMTEKAEPKCAHTGRLISLQEL